MDWWDDVYGFKMSALKELAYVEPIVDCVDARQVVTDAVPILTIDVQVRFWSICGAFLTHFWSISGLFLADF